jgi:diamine N-acetyltransferase
MQQVLEVLRADNRVKNIGISYEPQNEVARNLYAGFGFVEPGEMIGEEVLAVLNLR